jgi:hypothetical protein
MTPRTKSAILNWALATAIGTVLAFILFVELSK